MVRRLFLWLTLFELLLECRTAPSDKRIDEGAWAGTWRADVANNYIERRSNRFLLQSVEPIVITSGPSENEVVSRNDFPIVFRVPGNAATECLLSKGGETVRDWFLCTSPLPLNEALLEEAEYTLRIHKVGDPAMAVQSAAVVTFRVDLTEPDTKITSVKRRHRSSKDFIFKFTGVGKDVAFLQCELDYSGNWERCESPKKYKRLAYGEHAFRVRAVDIAGNVDSTPPEEIFEVETPFSPLPVVQRPPPSPSPPPSPPLPDPSPSKQPETQKTNSPADPEPAPEPPPETPSPSSPSPATSTIVETQLPSPASPPSRSEPPSDHKNGASVEVPPVESVPESNRGSTDSGRRMSDGEIYGGETDAESINEGTTAVHSISWDLWMTLVIILACVGAVIVVIVTVILCCARDSDPCFGGGRSSAVQDDGGCASTSNHRQSVHPS